MKTRIYGYTFWWERIDQENYLIRSEIPTPNGVLKEYEGFFSGILGHFLECCIFRHKSTKCTHTSFLYDKLQYRPIQNPPPPSQMHGGELYFNCMHTIPRPSIGFSKGQRFVQSNLMNFCIRCKYTKTVFWFGSLRK